MLKVWNKYEQDFKNSDFFNHNPRFKFRKLKEAQKLKQIRDFTKREAKKYAEDTTKYQKKLLKFKKQEALYVGMTPMQFIHNEKPRQPCLIKTFTSGIVLLLEKQSVVPKF